MMVAFGRRTNIAGTLDHGRALCQTRKDRESGRELLDE
jgi:hypothetical protein